LTTETPTTNVDGDPIDQMLGWLRDKRENEPVYRDEQGTWHLFRHADVNDLMTKPEVFSSDVNSFAPESPEFDAFQRGNVQAMDNPRHKRLRGMVVKAFTPRMVDRLAPQISAIAHDLLDVAGDRFDLVDALTYPLPVKIIAELLGVPVEDAPVFRKWADALFESVNPEPTKRAEEEDLVTLAPSIKGMCDYLRDHARARLKSPREDLISRLVAEDANGERLNEDEVVGFATTLLLAGHVTTTAILGSCVHLLKRFPDVEAQVRADRSLLPQVIEETLRIRPPAPRIGRVLLSDWTIDGTTMEAGSMVVAWLAAANLDPARYDDPERFDLRRRTSGHVAFGGGPHFCIGARLARLETQQALEVLLDRYADFSVDPDQAVEYYNPWLMLAVKHMPLVVSPHPTR
jgi:cytochrome P450